jgi:signal transduction histidine kinase
MGCSGVIRPRHWMRDTDGVTVRAVRALADPVAWRQVGLAGLGIPVAAVTALVLGVLVWPPLVALVADVRIATATGPLDPGTPLAVATWCAALALGLVLTLGVVAADRALVARLVPRSMAAAWPRLSWRGFFGSDAVWRRLLWLAVRFGVGVTSGLWTWFAVAGVAILLRGSWPPGPGMLWRPPVAGAIVLAMFHAGRGVGWLMTGIAHELLGPSPRDRIAELDARTAMLEQRAVLARELHDSVGHSVTVTVLQAAAARKVLERDPAYAARALGEIERAGRQAMDELGRVLDLLRAEDGGGAVATAGLRGLDHLLGTLRNAGLPVRLRVEGIRAEVGVRNIPEAEEARDSEGRAPAGYHRIEVTGLPEEVDAVAYRIVQEACTNVLRHAGGAPTVVTVAAGHGELRIEVVNEPAPAGPRTDRDAERLGGSGYGLDGLAEPVAALGGLLRAGPRPDGGFLVRARLPTGSS